MNFRQRKRHPPEVDDITASVPVKKMNGPKIAYGAKKKYFEIQLRNQNTRVGDIPKKL